jgi:hypothetical protein
MILAYPLYPAPAATCHDSHGVGNHSFPTPLNIGVGDLTSPTRCALSTSDHSPQQNHRRDCSNDGAWPGSHYRKVEGYRQGQGTNPSRAREPGHDTRGAFPSSHHREEGWPSDQENIAQHPLCARPGWCSDRRPRNTTPSASIRRLRAIYLMTPPPLLAVMRGGECAVSK